MDPKFKQLISLNLGLLCISTSGVFGRTLTLAPEVAIFWRCLFAMILLGLFLKIRGVGIKIRNGDRGMIFLGGLLMGIHWVTYFYSLSLAYVAIAILTLHTFPAMTAILEPLILKTKLRLYHLFLAALIILGIYIITPSLDLHDNLVLAIVFGLLSALTYALRNIYTRKLVGYYDGSSMMFMQLVVMSLLTLPFLTIKTSAPLVVDGDWTLILALALITTCIGHTLLVQNLKHYSAVSIGLMSSIIPVYGIIWPFIFLDEIPSKNVLLGGAIILTSFFAEAIVSNRERSIKQKELD